MTNEPEKTDILGGYGMQRPLPNATASLVLGILSLVFCFAYGVPGFILGIIGLVLANRDRALYQASPADYTLNSLNNTNAGRICSIIGVILSGLFLLFVVAIIIFGITMSTGPFFNH